MKIKFFLGLFAVGLLAFNYSNKKNSGKLVDLTSQNISLLQANASEIWCDASNSVDCYIGSARGTGNLVIKY